MNKDFMILKEILRERGMSLNELSFCSRIAYSDLNQAINGKRTFFPAWRKRVASALRLAEKEIFPED